MKEATHSRLSGDPMDPSILVLDLPSGPLPGLYVESEAESLPLRAPLRVVQAADGLVQLAHHLPAEVYARYGFAGGQSAGYRRYLEGFAARLQSELPLDTSIFEIGCGDGTLLDALQAVGFSDVAGIDPSPQAALGGAGQPPRFPGYFPDDLPPTHAARSFDVLICRHVLEHIESPSSFIAAAVARLNPGGALWIEVPDLKAAADRRWWTNFYALHCNYFEAATLDALLARHLMKCDFGEVVDIFGGSLLRRYRHGTGASAKPGTWGHLQSQSAAWQTALAEAAARLPAGSWGWGAAERTASALAYSPSLESKLAGVVDGNRQLHGRWMAGTSLRVHPPAMLRDCRPPAVVVFALSYADEIVKDLRQLVPAGTPVLVPSDPPRWLVV